MAHAAFACPPLQLLTRVSGAGVLPVQSLLDARDAGYISGGNFDIPLENFQPASLDLRLGQTAYRIQCSFLPGEDGLERRLKDFVIDELDLRDAGAVLEAKRPYLIPLKEHLALPATLRGKANPKSSTGRLDVFTRVITENGTRFDEIPAGYGGPLYLEVVPLSFAIRVNEDLTLSQLRLMEGLPELSDEDIRRLHQKRPILYRRGRPVPPRELPLSNGLFLSLDLRGIRNRTRIGYRAKRNAPLLDMTSRESIAPEPFWETIYSTPEGPRLILNPDDFYLIMSEESVSIPPDIASEMTAYDPTSGELRTHYAGFFDPGFGYDRENAFKGSRAALEIRAHDVPFLVEHGQPVCKLTFEWMLDTPLTQYGKEVRSNYQRQTETLSKYFFRGSDQPVDDEVHGDPREHETPDPRLPF